jgi:hypothetical protein
VVVVVVPGEAYDEYDGVEYDEYDGDEYDGEE